MTAERFRQIRNVFEAAMDHSEATRAAWLAEACRNDEPLREEVDALLRQYEKRSGVLDAPAAEAIQVTRLEGLQVGAWEILREIGRGGMAVVYLARRADGAFQMQAAVKVLNTPFADEEIRKRFQQERDILAQLDHPNIARLLDGGTTEEGLPYLVMEYVEGRPLTTWCDKRRADVEERLRLFEQLCDVVQYLHEHHVIHRDLKPTNVLVNAAGSVKLLDFGISKMLEPTTDQTMLLTRSGLHLLTPEYASPEQVRGERVTPQTDVYALGVILYELLTGRRPYRLRSRVMHEIVRAICGDDPERPSTAVTKADDSADTVTTSRLRQASPERLSRVLRGDLDEIALKALRKAPERRYRTARQLADDLSAHIQGKSVLARGDSWLVRMFQRLNGHRPAVALVIFAGALVGSGAISVNMRTIVYTAAALVAVGFWYSATDPKLGRRAPVLVWIFGFALLVLFAAIITALYHPATFMLELAFWGGGAIYGIGRYLSWEFRGRWAGELLMDASRTNKIAVVFCWALTLANVLFFFAGGPGRDYLWTLLWAIALASESLTASKLEFRGRGIVQAGRLIPWDEIRSYRWEGREGEQETLVLKIERHRLLPFLPVTRIKVDSSFHEITKIMNRYLSEWPI